MEKIVKRIADLRKAKGFSQVQMAEKLGFSQVSYSQIERGETKLTLSRVEEIAKLLEVDLYTLVGYEEENESMDFNSTHIPFKQIKELRRQKNISQIEMAEATGMSRGSYIAFEKGYYSTLSLKAAIAIAQKLNTCFIKLYKIPTSFESSDQFVSHATTRSNANFLVKRKVYDLQKNNWVFEGWIEHKQEKRFASWNDSGKLIKLKGEFGLIPNPQQEHDYSLVIIEEIPSIRGSIG